MCERDDWVFRQVMRFYMTPDGRERLYREICETLLAEFGVKTELDEVFVDLREYSYDQNTSILDLALVATVGDYCEEAIPYLMRLRFLIDQSQEE